MSRADVSLNIPGIVCCDVGYAWFLTITQVCSSPVLPDTSFLDTPFTLTTQSASANGFPMQSKFHLLGTSTIGTARLIPYCLKVCHGQFWFYGIVCCQSFEDVVCCAHLVLKYCLC